MVKREPPQPLLALARPGLPRQVWRLERGWNRAGETVLEISTADLWGDVHGAEDGLCSRPHLRTHSALRVQPKSPPQHWPGCACGARAASCSRGGGQSQRPPLGEGTSVSRLRAAGPDPVLEVGWDCAVGCPGMAEHSGHFFQPATPRSRRLSQGFGAGSCNPARVPNLSSLKLCLPEGSGMCPLGSEAGEPPNAFQGGKKGTFSFWGPGRPRVAPPALRRSSEGTKMKLPFLPKNWTWPFPCLPRAEHRMAPWHTDSAPFPHRGLVCCRGPFGGRQECWEPRKGLRPGSTPALGGSVGLPLAEHTGEGHSANTRPLLPDSHLGRVAQSGAPAPASLCRGTESNKIGSGIEINRESQLINAV